MYIEVEFNMLPIEVLQEDNGYVYGILSRQVPISPATAEFLRSVISDLKGYEVDSTINFIRGILLSSGYIFPQLPIEALPEFINLEEGHSQQVVDYLRRYGLFSLYDLRTPGLPEKIQSYWSDAHKNGLVPFAVYLKHIWQSQTFLGEAIKLAIAIRENDEAAFTSIVKDSGYSQPEVDVFYKGSWPQTARGLFCFWEDLLLHAVKLGVKDKNGRLVPTIASYGFKEALSLLVLDYLHREIPVGECQNPQCKKLFFVTRESKKFCSARCQALIKVHRYRKNQKVQNERRRAKDRKLPNPKRSK